MISIYYHGVVNGLVPKKFLQILKDQEIKSAAQQNYQNNKGFNESNYISVCEYLGEDIYQNYPNNAFQRYIFNHFCFVISSEVSVETPIL